MDPTATIDQVKLNFNPHTLTTLNVIIGFMMFGMALDIKLEDFKRVFKLPKAPAIGLGAQFVILPAVTFLLTLILRPAPSIALGMILVASCPGGNLSNLMTYLAGGNAALSVSMTAISTAVAVFMTPLNLSLYGHLNPHTAPILKEVSLSPWEVFVTIFMILGVPLTVGMLAAHYLPTFAQKTRKGFKILSVVVFLSFIVFALKANWEIFLKYVGWVFLVVMLHNGLALLSGYTAARLAKLSKKDVRAVAIEVGLQNSALGLVLVFDFFSGLGGMAIIAAWWGVWHIISGLSISFFWSRRPIVDIAEKDLRTA